jgi:integrase
MGLFKRGQTWWMKFTYKGRQFKRSTETIDKKLAERIYHKILGEIAEGKWFERLPGEDKTFREMIEKYLREYSARNKAPKSHIRDRSLANHLLQYFGDLTLTEITPKLIATFKTKRREEGAAPKTVNNELILMGHAFNIAIREWEWVKENPASRISNEKVGNIVERRLTFEEEKRLLAASPKWLQEIIVFALETGLRQSEILDLQWPRVDLFKRILSILQQKNKGKHTLPLDKTALEILKTRAKIRHINSNYVFFKPKWRQNRSKKPHQVLSSSC